MPTLLELKTKRMTAITAARKINERMRKGDTVSAEERTQMDGYLKEAEETNNEIKAQQSDEARSSRLAALEDSLAEVRGRRTREEQPEDGDDESDKPQSRQRDAVRDARFGQTLDPRELRYKVGMAYGRERTRTIQFRGKTARPKYQAAFRNYLRHGVITPDLIRGEQRANAAGEVDLDDDDAVEQRSLQAGIDVEGGYLIAPVQMAAGLIQAVDDALVIRQLATVHRLTASQSLGMASLDTDPDDAEWTSEIAQVTEDQAMRLGRRELNPRPLAKLIKISRTLMRFTPSIEDLVNERMGYKFGVTQEKAFMTGNGAEKPLGLFTASNSGIPTSRDVSADNTTTAITANNLIRVKRSLKPQYRSRAVWVYHPDAMTQVELLKDTNGQYLWRMGLTGEAPDTLLGRPIIESYYAPNTFTTGQYVGLFGDMSFYHIAETMGIEFTRLNELFQLTNQVGVIGRQDVDAMPALAEAFARVKLA